MGVSLSDRSDYRMITDKLRQEALRLLTEQNIKYVIGWQPGSYGLRISPAFVNDVNSVDDLLWSPFCINSLAVYPTLAEKLPLPRGVAEDTRSIAVLVKGCDSRGLVQMFAEFGYPKERVVIIGIPCTGQIDPEKLVPKLIEKGIDKNIMMKDLEVTDLGDGFGFKTDKGTFDISKFELIYDKCLTCKYPNPLIHDILLSDPVKPRDEGLETYEKVNELAGLQSWEKWSYWVEKFQRCIRCYACRNICPVCYCKECLTDKWEPDWINKSVNITENTMFHLTRALHLAGRCVSCHECERACPVGIPLLDLYKHLSKEVLDQFEFEPGVNIEAKPVLSTFNPDDPGEFIL